MVATSWAIAEEQWRSNKLFGYRLPRLKEGFKRECEVMAKKVAIGAKPQPRRVVTPDEWVAGTIPEEKAGSDAAPVPAEKAQSETIQMKRFTIDIPTGLHRRIKIKCVDKGVKMREEILELLEKHFK